MNVPLTLPSPQWGEGKGEGSRPWHLRRPLQLPSRMILLNDFQRQWADTRADVLARSLFERGYAHSTAGNISDGGITLPTGSSVTYTATCNIGAAATGSLANTATATTPRVSMDALP